MLELGLTTTHRCSSRVEFLRLYLSERGNETETVCLEDELHSRQQFAIRVVVGVV